MTRPIKPYAGAPRQVQTGSFDVGIDRISGGMWRGRVYGQQHPPKRGQVARHEISYLIRWLSPSFSRCCHVALWGNRFIEGKLT
jgi:hypothetical protein